jgi:hypothetical protein
MRVRTTILGSLKHTILHGWYEGLCYDKVKNGVDENEGTWVYNAIHPWVQSKHLGLPAEQIAWNRRVFYNL